MVEITEIRHAWSCNVVIKLNSRLFEYNVLRKLSKWSMYIHYWSDHTFCFTLREKLSFLTDPKCDETT